MGMGEITKIAKATTMSDSLRTTIPMGIVKHFNLEEGDKLDWEIRPEGEKLIIIVRPLEVKE